jgi:putative acetyltransferase
MNEVATLVTSFIIGFVLTSGRCSTKHFMQITRTNSDHPHFIQLVEELDKDLALRDGNDHFFYSQYNTIQNIRHTVVVYDHGMPVGCGAIKEYDDQSMEVKRMYTLPPYRGKGVAMAALTALEGWAAELGYTRCVLETGKRQPEAIALYEKSGYHITANYGQYVGVDNSVCFEKLLNQPPELPSHHQTR